MRQLLLDTETTGLNPKDGHRIIEIGCVEMINRRVTDNRFHCYINPERAVDAEALAVHGLSDEFLADKPLFNDVLDDFLAYIDGAELIIHNAPFDIGFLDYQLKHVAKRKEKISTFCSVTDTLLMARDKHPGQRNSLDALCKRYNVSNAHRELHGALLDAEILAYVYLAMTGGQANLFGGAAKETTTTKTKHARNTLKRPDELLVLRATAAEEKAHQDYLTEILGKTESD